LRSDGTQEVEYLCELDLAEERMAGGFGSGRSLVDEFFSGRTVDFKHSVVIMTSNLGADRISSSRVRAATSTGCERS
jgi:AAA domain (Cdc48 subfamily)